MGKKRFVPLLLLLLVAAAAEAGRMQAPHEQLGSLKKLEEGRNCGGEPCWISLLRQKRQEEETSPAPETPAEEPATGDASATGDDAVAAGAPAPAPPGGDGSSEKPAGDGGALLPVSGEIPLPPVTQQMPNLPKNFPYPNVKVVQEPPVPTKPRKKPIMGVNPNPFPSIGPIGPIEPEPPMSDPIDSEDPPGEPGGEPEPVIPVDTKPSIRPTKPATPCSGDGFGPPQDWRFPKARGHKKCPTEVKGGDPPAVRGPAPEDEDSVKFRTVSQRDDEAAPAPAPGAAGSPAAPGNASASPALICSMKTVLPAVVATVLYTVL